jgi:restriction system protein
MASKSDFPSSVPDKNQHAGSTSSEEPETGGRGKIDDLDHTKRDTVESDARGPVGQRICETLDLSLSDADVSIVPDAAQDPDRLRRRLEVREKQQQADRYLRAIGQATAPPSATDIPWQERLLECLLKMKPDAFERLCQKVLRESGFIRVEVTGQSGDGGIDGIGVLRLNLLSFHVLFQCKRWKGSVGASAIRDFRGAMVGRTDKGLVMTTGTFTVDARKEAARDGAPAIDLVDGEDLCELLKRLEIGVSTRKVEHVMVEQQAFLEF